MIIHRGWGNLFSGKPTISWLSDSLSIYIYIYMHTCVFLHTYHAHIHTFASQLLLLPSGVQTCRSALGRVDVSGQFLPSLDGDWCCEMVLTRKKKHSNSRKLVGPECWSWLQIQWRICWVAESLEFQVIFVSNAGCVRAWCGGTPVRQLPFLWGARRTARWSPIFGISKEIPKEW